MSYQAMIKIIEKITNKHGTGVNKLKQKFPCSIMLKRKMTLTHKHILAK